VKVNTKKIIGLVGETGSGKDTFCGHLKRNLKNVYVFRFSQSLTEALRIFFDEVKKEDQQWLAICLRERFGNNILGEAIKKKVRGIKKGTIVLNGVRALEEAKMVRKLGGRMIYITAESRIRWQRVGKRGEKKDDSISYKKFLKIDKVKAEILISKIGKKSAFKIENNGSLKDFYEKIKPILKKI